jgi:hypothetical protein
MRALLAMILIGCAPSLPSSYVCQTTSQCWSNGVQGVCEPTGACSFPDANCLPSRRRYGDLGPPALAGSCVGDSDGGAGSGDIVRIGSSTLAPGTYGSHATLAAPGTLAAGDVLFASLYANDSAATVTAPSGWTVHADLQGSIGVSFRATWLYHIAGAAEPSSWDFVFSLAPNVVAGAVVAYHGVRASTPVDVGSNQVFQVSSGFVAPSITTRQPGDMLVALFVDAVSQNLSWNAPAGMQTAVSLDPIGVFDAVQPSAGASGDKQASLGFQSPAVGAVDFVALAPAR